MVRFIYTVIFILALPAIFSRLWWKDKKVPGYRIRWPERFGVFPDINTLTERPLVWVHAVSVGEVVAATPLIHRLLEQEHISVMITTMTPTGSERVRASFGQRVFHVYAPYDLPWTVRNFLRRTQPALAIIMETELWPNVLSVCAEQKLPVILANARLSARSARGYSRFKRSSQRLVNHLAHVAAQNRPDGKRFVHLGLPSDKLTVTGNIKFDIQVPPNTVDAAQALRQAYRGAHQRPIVVAASTHEGEESQILQAFTQVLERHPQTLLILVPRHPERFDGVAQMCQQHFVTERRSQSPIPAPETQVLVGDTMGEMILFYGCADIAFVGGSLIPRGGHNTLEPAYWGLPILCGPHVFNFADISKRLLQRGGMVQVNNADQLAQQIGKWLDAPEERRQVGRHAQAFFLANRGAIDRLMTLVHRYVPITPKPNTDKSPIGE